MASKKVPAAPTPELALQRIREEVAAEWKPVRCNCGAETCTRHGLNVGCFYQGSGFDTLQQAQLAAAAPRLALLLKEAADHLDYTGYGDKWEREYAQATKLDERITAMLKELGL
jgi:hypothetical protein